MTDLHETTVSPSPHLNDVIAVRVSRRTVLAGGMAAAATFLAGGRLITGALPAAAEDDALTDRERRRQERLLGFDPIPAGYDDLVHVPAGYSHSAFIPWGTPLLGSMPAFVAGTPPLVPGGNTAEDQGEQIGMHHDGMWYFPLYNGRRGNAQGLLCVNHEFTDEGYLHTGAYQPSTWVGSMKAQWTREMVQKSQNAHGVSVVHISRNGGQWEVVPSHYNRRITANTPMKFSGPATGHRLLKTGEDPAGRTPRGTVNNCAKGHTPWGTYLTCEENFNGYFRVDRASAATPEQAQLITEYGVGGDAYNWAVNDDRFVVTPEEPNEANRFGWVVEIDPFDPESTPVKRTALGRTKHEGADIFEGKGGRVVGYMGDDQVNEYIYKFVSAGNWRSMRARGKSPLDEGTLYVARFNDDGSGQWLPLVHGEGPLVAEAGFADQGDILVKTRLAADALGATPMDRPEWTAVDANTGLVYCTLTNNTSAAKVVNAANPRKPNRWGSIIRWEEHDGDHTATSFHWDIFLLAGPGRDSATPDGSDIAAEDAFGSPDGLWIDPDGRVWIQTDGTQPNASNDQMLVAHPSLEDNAGVPEVKRFLTGPIGCEVTGITSTPDQQTMFVNIQHPGESGVGTWPFLEDLLDTPRSASVIITKDGGGKVGS